MGTSTGMGLDLVGTRVRPTSSCSTAGSAIVPLRRRSASSTRGSWLTPSWSTGTGMGFDSSSRAGAACAPPGRDRGFGADEGLGITGLRISCWSSRHLPRAALLEGGTRYAGHPAQPSRPIPSPALAEGAALAGLASPGLVAPVGGMGILGTGYVVGSVRAEAPGTTTGSRPIRTWACPTRSTVYRMSSRCGATTTPPPPVVSYGVAPEWAKWSTSRVLCRSSAVGR